jgi:hypothetical protein
MSILILERILVNKLENSGRRRRRRRSGRHRSVPARGVGGGEAQDVEAPAAARGVGGGEDEGVEAPADALGVGGGEAPAAARGVGGGEAHRVWGRARVSRGVRRMIRSGGRRRPDWDDEQ